ncbi:DUF1778 domain-containing protein [Sphingomonas lenta]|uniref:DUF1778 domain-containing protein n=1 Tax=Sphingomonas lenta TaxID=1141887 RepID=A0A2A2SCZ3_9SPHN|nr:DUF1778 domain-containing protein [Sphingomonas lenta]PAX07119.1 hypothetical protein CKY28_13830 [Sphingomonas lenta]
MPGVAFRTRKISIRVSPDAKRLLQTAASASRRSLSEFVLESALARAAETLPDRQRFGLDADAWAAFQAALDAPPRSLPRLRRLLSEPSVFEDPAPQ